MEVILKEDVNKLGHRGDVVKVADGYGRNYLLPGKLAPAVSAERPSTTETAGPREARPAGAGAKVAPDKPGANALVTSDVNAVM